MQARQDPLYHKKKQSQKLVGIRYHSKRHNWILSLFSLLLRGCIAWKTFHFMNTFLWTATMDNFFTYLHTSAAKRGFISSPPPLSVTLLISLLKKNISYFLFQLLTTPFLNINDIPHSPSWILFSVNDKESSLISRRF